MYWMTSLSILISAVLCKADTLPTPMRTRTAISSPSPRSATWLSVAKHPVRKATAANRAARPAEIRFKVVVGKPGFIIVMRFLRGGGGGGGRLQGVRGAAGGGPQRRESGGGGALGEARVPLKGPGGRGGAWGA